MAENPYQFGEDTEPATERPVRRRVDLFAVIIGIGTLLVSAYTLTDGATWLPPADLRWTLAGGAVLLGVLMLGASLRGGRRR
ncbi:hypothetical protein ORV05_29825 [Amycolatopsis cynarae]|uniref:Uncharacterized protein n=1 Tax=Amycolatopsis cynarae TaxID=2995223 RepID=A0ABY7AYS2_9PSEU|nr:hypothetical protein [Amycolatopsis sp. HUAS 11-8]WAL65076.1 hypothetical protein ORV05_29825 [Amycolatopsis sp. HUAS 11-8]